jgi:hypothetical protein
MTNRGVLPAGNIEKLNNWTAFKTYLLQKMEKGFTTWMALWSFGFT